MLCHLAWLLEAEKRREQMAEFGHAGHMKRILTVY
jgi:hypothetical protein